MAIVRLHVSPTAWSRAPPEDQGAYHGCCAVDKLGAALCRVSNFLGGQRVDAPAVPVWHFEDGHSLPAHKPACRHQARRTGTDHEEMR
jgi:hypothetical protein